MSKKKRYAYVQVAIRVSKIVEIPDTEEAGQEVVMDEVAELDEFALNFPNGWDVESIGDEGDVLAIETNKRGRELPGAMYFLGD